MARSTVLEDILLPLPPAEDFVALRHCGHQHCEPGHTFGPSVRDHFLIHFAVAGKGVFCKDGREYLLHAGQGFLIVPGEITTYRADAQEPWEYFWFGFAGRAAEALLPLCGLSAQAPVFRCDDPLAAARRLNRLLQCAHRPTPGRERELLGHMFSFLSLAQGTACAAAQRVADNAPARQAMQYLQENYSYDISVEDIAWHVGLSRSQLFRVFKAAYGHSVRDALLTHRLSAAQRMLARGGYTVTQVCFSCGFSDPAYFSAAFRRRFGLSPRAYACSQAHS